MKCKRETGEDRKFPFSQKAIGDLPPHDPSSPSAMTEYSDRVVSGLKLVVGTTGRKFFWHRYRFRGKKKMVRLGEYPSMSIAEARQIANNNKNMVDRDLDPSDERNKRRQVPTLAEFAAKEYLPYAKLRKRSWRDDESKLRREIGQMLGNVPINQITPRDIVQLHAAIQNKASGATANRYLALLSRMFNLAIRWEHLDKNPAASVEKCEEAGPRLRSLEGQELSRFLSAIEAEAGKTTANALSLLLLTGLRSKSELFSLPWSEVDFERGTVRLLRTKNKKVRTVALNSRALELLKKLRDEATPGCPWVFPARSGDGHLVDIRKPLGRALKRAGISDVRPHDLRRSFGSLAVNAGVDIYQVKDLLGHSSVAVTQRVYAHLLQDTLRNASEVVGRTVGAAWESVPCAGDSQEPTAACGM